MQRGNGLYIMAIECYTRGANRLREGVTGFEAEMINIVLSNFHDILGYKDEIVCYDTLFLSLDYNTSKLSIVTYPIVEGSLDKTFEETMEVLEKVIPTCRISFGELFGNKVHTLAQDFMISTAIGLNVLYYVGVPLDKIIMLMEYTLKHGAFRTLSSIYAKRDLEDAFVISKQISLADTSPHNRGSLMGFILLTYIQSAAIARSFIECNALRKNLIAVLSEMDLYDVRQGLSDSALKYLNDNQKVLVFKFVEHFPQGCDWINNREILEYLSSAFSKKPKKIIGQIEAFGSARVFNCLYRNPNYSGIHLVVVKLPHHAPEITSHTCLYKGFSRFCNDIKCIIAAP